MNKKILIMLLACVLCLTGCSLAREEAVSKESDRLVGVYLTTAVPDPNDEHWVEHGSFTADTEFGKIPLPNRILPAEFDPETKNFVFPGLPGYALFEATVKDGEDVYTTSQSDFLDGSFHVTTTDFGDSFELSGTLYVGEDCEDTIWNANVVYQTADGLVYLDGSGNSYSGVGGGFSSKLEENHKTTVNGEEGSTFTKVEFSIQSTDELQTLLIRQYNAEGEPVDAQTLSAVPGEQTVAWAEGAAWAVVEEHFSDHVSRTAYDYPSENAEDIVHTAICLNKDHIGEASTVFFRK